MRDLYVRHCVEFLHAALGNYGSGMQRRIETELRAIFQVESLGPKVAPLRVGIQASYLYHSDRLRQGLLGNMSWMQSAHERAPGWTEVENARCIYFPAAAELRRGIRGHSGV